MSSFSVLVSISEVYNLINFPFFWPNSKQKTNAPELKTGSWVSKFITSARALHAVIDQDKSSCSNLAGQCSAWSPSSLYAHHQIQCTLGHTKEENLCCFRLSSALGQDHSQALLGQASPLVEQSIASKEVAWGPTNSARLRTIGWSSESWDHRQQSRLSLKRVRKQQTLFKNFNSHSDEELKLKLKRITWTQHTLFCYWLNSCGLVDIPCRYYQYSLDHSHLTLLPDLLLAKIHRHIRL